MIGYFCAIGLVGGSQGGSIPPRAAERSEAERSGAERSGADCGGLYLQVRLCAINSRLQTSISACVRNFNFESLSLDFMLYSIF